MDPESLTASSFDKDTEGEFILVALVDNEIVGFVSVWSRDNFIHHLYVSNHFQNKGIGLRLLNSLIKKAPSELTLKCLVKNKLALNFYLNKDGKQYPKAPPMKEITFYLSTESLIQENTPRQWFLTIMDP